MVCLSLMTGTILISRMCLSPPAACPATYLAPPRLSDIAVPVAEVVKGQSFHDRLRMEMDILEGYDLEEAVRYTQVGGGGGPPGTEGGLGAMGAGGKGGRCGAYEAAAGRRSTQVRGWWPRGLRGSRG